MIRRLKVRTAGKGLFEVTDRIQRLVSECGWDDGLCTVMIQHTSASLTIQENADPSARADLEAWIERLVPEGDPAYTHTFEGPDDMPAHIRSALTATTLSIPFEHGQLSLGTWQGVYVWEHRTRGAGRSLVVHLAQ